ncbi:MAG TPA: PIN domain-containing protein [Bacteroidia bacterium]|nr:PIN domain-containing protein [Bacteroidia bacterium]
MKYLVDTNIFLEVLLNQEKKVKCKKFLNDHAGQICLSDFSLHSVGVILFRYSRTDIFDKFVEDLQHNAGIVSLPFSEYRRVAEARKKFTLDFDDSYQLCVAKNYDLAIVTMDKDFKAIKDTTVLFL